jgi:hypothetical protein
MKQMIALAAFAALLCGCASTGYRHNYTATSFETVNYGVVGYGSPGSRW